MNGRMKKWFRRWPEIKRLLRNDFREEIGYLSQLQGTESGCKTGTPCCKKNGGPTIGRAIVE